MEVTETDVKGASGSSAGLGEDGSAESPTRQQSAATQHQMKLIKPLLSSASRLGKALAELFGLLVKVSSSDGFGSLDGYGLLRYRLGVRRGGQCDKIN